jgi:purine-nucleoside phosphorylase
MTAIDETALANLVRRPDVQARWGVILGSGFQAFVDSLRERTVHAYAELPGLPAPSVAGHSGNLIQGWLGRTPVAVAQGRLHGYEGHDPFTSTVLVRLLHALGCQSLLLTNASGGVNPQFRVGDLMLITDHVNFLALTGSNPLRGPQRGQQERFVSMGDAYDPALQQAALRAASELGVALVEGVYGMVSGPSFETPAELRFLRAIGVDAVGMSTASETIVARSLGMKVLGISCVSNAAHGDTEGVVAHLDVIQQVARRVPDVVRVVQKVMEEE